MDCEVWGVVLALVCEATCQRVLGFSRWTWGKKGRRMLEPWETPNKQVSQLFGLVRDSENFPPFGRSGSTHRNMKPACTGALLTLFYSFRCGVAFEWAGIFETPESDYLWTAQKVDGAYADPAMRLVALPAATHSQQALKDLEAQGTAAMNLATCTAVQAGGTIIPAANTCYSLQFQESAWQTLFNVNASAVTGIAFFAEHVPTEFEATAHYLKDSLGEDIEPLGELPEAQEAAVTTDPGAFLAALLVNLVTFIGVIMMFGPLRRLSQKPVFSAMLFAFASGAILACAFFLLLFESTHLIGVGWKTEVDVLWRWGAMILAGIVVPPVVETMVSLIMMASSTGDSSSKPAVEDAETAAELQGLDDAQKFRAKARLCGGVIIGDFFHNLCDGFFIGAAFQGCGNAFGWSVAAGTILHELPQEIADFIILTGPVAGLSPLKALVFNFLSGLSVLLGALIVAATPVDDALIGLILAFGGGVYIHVGATDCLPKMYNPKLTFAERLLAFASFVLGCILIGLILIGHEHCVPEGGEHHH